MPVETKLIDEWAKNLLWHMGLLSKKKINLEHFYKVKEEFLLKIKIIDSEAEEAKKSWGAEGIPKENFENLMLRDCI